MLNASIVLCAAFFVCMGAAALWRPRGFARRLELDATSALALSEVRAVYGGYGLAMGALLLAALAWRALLPGVAVAIGAAMAGMLLGRLVSWAAERRLPRRALLFAGIEAALAAILFTTAFLTTTQPMG